jgi:hypothetical protein
MSPERLRQPERAPSAELIGCASLAGYVLRFWKSGRDGSGKCTVVETGVADDRVHGVLIRLPADEKASLDLSEGLGEHYLERQLEVLVEGASRCAWTYVARPERIDTGLRPFGWYKQLVTSGARLHRLPVAYLAELDAVEAHADPDVERARRGRAGIIPY